MLSFFKLTFRLHRDSCIALKHVAIESVSHNHRGRSKGCPRLVWQTNCYYTHSVEKIYTFNFFYTAWVYRSSYRNGFLSSSLRYRRSLSWNSQLNLTVVTGRPDCWREVTKFSKNVKKSDCGQSMQSRPRAGNTSSSIPMSPVMARRG